MPRQLTVLSAAAILTGFLFAAPSPAYAQASCMHCNFAHGKCNMFKSGKEAQCAKEREVCIEKCKADAKAVGEQSKAADEKTKK